MAETLAPGELFADRYVVERLLGSGGMGSVYSVYDQELGERVALKLLTSHQSSPEAVRSFKREVRLARRVTSPFVARTHDLGSVDARWFLTMQLVDGTDLRTKMKTNGRPSAARALWIARDIARGLASAHAVGVVHRDLKPANVVIDPEGRAILTDFGVAMATTSRGPGLAGTPAWMAPEQLRNQRITARCDMYALGLVLYQLLVGKKAWPPGRSGWLARLREPPPDPRHGAPEVSVELAAWVVRLLATDPADRPSAADTAQGLEALAQGPVAAPVAEAAPVVAVLPTQLSGDADQPWMAEDLQGGVIDRLCRCDGLSVLAASVVVALGARPPLSALRGIGASHAVESSLRLRGEVWRVDVRLFDVAAGQQLWNERFSEELSGWLDLEDGLSLRIAEGLRVELTLQRAGNVPASATRAFLAARRELRSAEYRFAHVLPLLDQAVAEAPHLAAAHALRALALVRHCWLVRDEDAAQAAEAATTALRTARRLAPQEPATWLAMADHRLLGGQLEQCIEAAQRALELAPTYPPAMAWLALMDCEAGDRERGRRRLEDVARIDPSHWLNQLERGRQLALDGAFDEALDLLSAVPGAAASASRARVASWAGQRAIATAEAEGCLRESGGVWPQEHPRLYLRALAGQLDSEQLAAAWSALPPPPHPRWRTLTLQLACEAHVVLGDHVRATERLGDACDALLLDVPWLDRCPLLEPLRDSDAFEAVRRSVRVRGARLYGQRAVQP